MSSSSIHDAVKMSIVTTAASEATTAAVASFSASTAASMGLSGAVRAAVGATFPAISIGLLAYTAFSLWSEEEEAVS